MPTRPYLNANGDRVPGVTTVIGNLGWSRDALMRWANREGLAGRDIRGPKSRDTVAAERGTAVHAMIEAWTHGYDPCIIAEYQALTLDEADLAYVAFRSFRRWEEDSGLRLVATEIYGVSERLQVGFCLDGLALRHTGEMSLVDYKTGKGPFPDHLIQVAQYVELCEELYGEWTGPLDGAYILRASSSGVYHHVFFPNEALAVGREAFKHLLWLHKHRRQVEEFVR